jgi:hypothetical protein
VRILHRAAPFRPHTLFNKPISILANLLSRLLLEEDRHFLLDRRNRKASRSANRRVRINSGSRHQAVSQQFKRHHRRHSITSCLDLRANQVPVKHVAQIHLDCFNLRARPGIEA